MRKKISQHLQLIIFSNYSNWTFNLSLFNFAIKNEIEVYNEMLLFSSLAFDTFRGGDNEQKMKSFKLDFVEDIRYPGLNEEDKRN